MAQNTILGWTALIVALLALILAWVAFNRTGVDVQAAIEAETERRTAELRAEFESLEQELRDRTAAQLEDAAQDVETDENATSTGIDE